MEVKKDNNFENVEVKESQAAELESIKELFYAGEQRLVGIKDNVVSFSCDKCEEIGTIMVNFMKHLKY